MIKAAKYYDGKSSLPIMVELIVENEKLILQSTTGSIEWPIINCRIRSLNSSNNLMIVHGDTSLETLEFNEKDYPAIAELFTDRESILNQSYQSLKKYSAFQIFAVGIFIISSSIILYTQYLSPWIGHQAVKMIPQSIEVKIGEAILKNFDIYDQNIEKQRLLNEFLSICDYKSDYPININYIADNTINAFALPGGQLIIHQGILDIMDCSDQLAGLLGHELAHVNQRHSMKTLARSFSSYMVFSVLTGDVAGASGIFIDQASQMNQLVNSRTYEKEADKVGYQYMVSNGLSPIGMRDLFMKIKDKTTISIDSTDFDLEYSVLKFISTHPSLESRIKFLDRERDVLNADIIKQQQLDSIWLLIKA